MRLASLIAEQHDAVLHAWHQAFVQAVDAATVARTAMAWQAHALAALALLARDATAAPSDEGKGEVEAAATNGPPSTRSSLEAPLASPLAGTTTAAALASARPALPALPVAWGLAPCLAAWAALRASVLQVWTAQTRAGAPFDVHELLRFNGLIDQAVAAALRGDAEQAAGRAAQEGRLLEAVLEAAPVGLCVVDGAGQLQFANAEHRRIWGEPPAPGPLAAPSTWQGWWADASPRQGQALEAEDWVLARALAGAQAQRGTVAIEPFDVPGSRRTVLQRATPVRDGAGEVIGAVLAQTDITTQVITEAALRESEAKFRTIADAMPQMVWSTRPDGFHDYYNQRWYDFTGVPANSTDGEAWNGMFHPDDQARAWAVWRHSLATGEPYEVHYRLRHRSGEYRWTLGRALPLKDEAGGILRWMGTCTDIHDQKLAEEALLRQSARKDEFLAMLAHELRNPLAPISTAARLLSMGTPDDARVKRSSEIIARQVKHMTALVDDLLDVSRVTRGLVQLDSERVDLQLIVGHAVEQVRPLIEARQHALVLQPAQVPAWVQGDRTRLVQIVANLLNNAAKYTPQGGCLTVRWAVQDEVVSLDVADTGSGIAPALLPHVFDLFAQGERSPDRSQGGLGLGLTVVKHLTTLHGGRISVRSDGPGLGSVFTVVLPRAAALHTPPAAQALDGTASQGRAVKVMVVDDNVDAAESLAALLTLAGHEVRAVHEATQALAAPDRAAVQVFILDIGLPGMDGYDLARRLRAEASTAGALIVALTGYGQAHDRVLSKAAGFDHHFVKPVDTQALEALLERVAVGAS
jgi:PAS domain S-box-containing protein